MSIRMECTADTFRPATDHRVRWWRKSDWAHMYRSSQGMFMGPPWERKEWERLYDQGYEYCGVVRNRQAVAIAGLWRRRKKTWEVIAVGTSEKYRGRGYAKAVISCVTQRILESVPRATITTLPQNIALQKAAEAVGFRRIRTTREPVVGATGGPVARP